MQKINFNDRYGLTQAVIEGRKTNTRRFELDADSEYIARHYNPIYKPQHCYYRDSRGMCQLINSNTRKLFIPRYKVGEVVAVAQRYSTIAAGHPDVDTFLLQVSKAHKISIESMHELAGWNNKMFTKAELMPHQIRITGIKCEGLQDISDEDCIREGVNGGYIEEVNGGYIGYYVPGIKCRDWKKESHVETTDGGVWKLFPTPRKAFASLIDKVSGRGTWDLNLLAAAYEFELVK